MWRLRLSAFSSLCRRVSASIIQSNCRHKLETAPFPEPLADSQRQLAAVSACSIRLLLLVASDTRFPAERLVCEGRRWMALLLQAVVLLWLSRDGELVVKTRVVSVVTVQLVFSLGLPDEAATIGLPCEQIPSVTSSVLGIGA